MLEKIKSNGYGNSENLMRERRKEKQFASFTLNTYVEKVLILTTFVF